MKIYDFTLISGQQGNVIAASIPAARVYLAGMKLEPISIKFSQRGTLNLLLGGGMTLQRRNIFYRTLEQRLDDEMSPIECLRVMTLSIQDVRLLQACYIILQALGEGVSFAHATKLAGFPPEDVRTLEAGEKSSYLLESIQALERETTMLSNLKRTVVASLYGSLAAIIILWIVFFVAIAFLLPYVHETLITATGTKDTLSPGVKFIFSFGLWMKEWLPFSAIAYYSVPFWFWLTARAFQVTAADIMSIIPTAQMLLIKIDMLRATQIIARYLKFKSSFSAAITGVLGTMRTRQMQDGFTVLVHTMGQGISVTEACHRSALPIEFSHEISRISQSKNPIKYLDKYAAILYNDIPPLGFTLKTTITFLTLILAAFLISGIVSLTYLPIIKATLAAAAK